MTKSQKVWVKPELIILVRSKPEEAVLAACKGGSFLTDPGSFDGNCKENALGFCGFCFLTFLS